jgi:replicative DNA helicase
MAITNYETIALAKLADGDLQLLSSLDPSLFTGVYSPIFQIVRNFFSENHKLPTIATLEAAVLDKAPKAQLPVVTGILTAIKSVDTENVATKEVVKGLRDKKLLNTLGEKVKELTDATIQKDVDNVRGILSSIVEDTNTGRVAPEKFQDAMNALDTSKIITSGIEGLDGHLTGFAGLTIVSGGSGCVDELTEFLTPTGWKSIAEYQEGDLVLQWNPDGSTEFVRPTEYIKKPADTWYRLKTDYGVDQMLSPEHRVPYISSKGNLNVKTMEALYEQHLGTKDGFSGSFISSFAAPDTEGVPYTEVELRLMVAISADSNIQSRKRVAFNLKKPEKKSRLTALLEEAGIEYSRSDTTDTGYSRIAFQPPKVTKDLKELWAANKEQLQTIFDEVRYWDGSIDHRTGNIIYHTTDKDNADFIQYVINTCTGKKASIFTNNRVGQPYKTYGKEYTRKSIEYSVSQTSTSTIGIKTNKKPKDETVQKTSADEGAYKYCFVVPSSYFVMRRNDCIVVTGNSGKTAFLLEAAIGQHKQGLNVLFISLELSAQVLGQRLKSSLTGIPFSRIIANDLDEQERQQVEAATDDFFSTDKNFRVVTDMLDSDELLTLIRVEKAIHNIDVVYIDYLNLIGAPSGSESGWRNLSDTAKALHRLSMELGVVSVSASQVDLEKAPKGNSMPQIRTRGSAELLFSATLLIFLYKPEAVEEDDDTVILYVMKNRNNKQTRLLMEADFSLMRYKFVMAL